MTPFDIVVTRHGARFLGRQFPCSIGRGGIVPARAKREGDGATPAGVHRLVGMLYHPARLTRPADWALPTAPADRWSDDSADPDYNLMVRLPHRFSHERLQRPDPLYDLVIITDWNWPHAEPERGSAIFLHTWRKPRFPTAGCVAFARSDLLWIAARIKHRTRLIIRS
ncbi:L,D-transpeptidase family protein [Pseudotabrizicola algicola]|uniref:L,D-transpeptidase family protein n=1 Tax=Pseudotabrizicola algicola TaxID=2709381 RepID=A0A6B3RL35_9RHOB|nr:L,D-transpeptidase family protein [Pseudotabrizicola algicola]